MDRRDLRQLREMWQRHERLVNIEQDFDIGSGDVPMTDLFSLLQRYSDDGKSTLGLLLLGTEHAVQFLCYTLEDEQRELKLVGDTRIPAGRYQLKLRQELTPLTEKYRARFPWFIWHIEIMDVPNFANIYVHVGNEEGDTAGCILLGDNVTGNIAAAGFIGGSTKAFERWYNIVARHLAAGGAVVLEIRDETELLRRST